VFDAADQTRRPLMVHHAGSKIPTPTLLKTLRRGDVYTHLYHPHADHGFDEHGAPLDAMLEARERGVLFDVGHGAGSFVWQVAEPACREFGFWPDTISTDVHQLNIHGPVYDMPTTMTKFLHLGMPVEQIIKATTSMPAKAIGLQERLGALKVGMQADVVLLKREHGAFSLADTQQQERVAGERLAPVRVCKKGKWRECG
jgi:dihydroorotase